MKYRKRIIEEKILKIYKQFQSVIVNGARQTGKSTLLDHLFGNELKRIVFDPVIDIGNARQSPELFLSLNPPPVILDEIQYVPELIPVIKRMVDEKRGTNGLFLITGSQQFSVIKAISESLAGRAAVIELPQMSCREIEERCDRPSLLIEALNPDRTFKKSDAPKIGSQNPAKLIFRGGYPNTMELDEDYLSVWFESYLKTYVERDIRTLGDVDDQQTFTRFVKLAAQLSAQEINHSHVGREIGVDPKTAKKWLSILKASYQWLEIPAYSGNTTKRLSEKPKGYFSDTGFACYLSSVFSADSLSAHPLFGNFFEAYAVGEIIKTLQYLPAQPAVYHWRSYAGAEVDLIIEKDGYFTLIEIKLSMRPSLNDLRGMKAFQETYPQNKIAGRIVLHSGAEMFMLDKSTIAMPVWSI